MDKEKLQGITIKLTYEQKQAIKRYIAKLNRDLISQGLPKISETSWLKELALKHSGNSDLGIKGKLEKHIKALDNI